MKITAWVRNAGSSHEVVLETDGARHAIDIPAKETGSGSKANGGELLFLSLATCFCNDLYREAAKRGVPVRRVEVEVEGEFGGPGEAARSVTYRARVEAEAGEQEIRDLIAHTDRVTEIQNTLRRGTPVTLVGAEVVRVSGNGGEA